MAKSFLKKIYDPIDRFPDDHHHSNRQRTVVYISYFGGLSALIVCVCYLIFIYGSREVGFGIGVLGLVPFLISYNFSLSAMHKTDAMYKNMENEGEICRFADKKHKQGIVLIVCTLLTVFGCTLYIIS